jgi:hypothetical protein
LAYNQSGNYGWTDPTSGQTYQIPTFTATQTLTPQGQAIQTQNLAAQLNLAGMANAQSAKISNLLSNPMNLSGAPSAGNAQNLLNVPAAATSFAPGGPIQTSLGNAGQIAQSYGPNDFSADRQNVQDALMARMNPQLAIEKQGIQQQLSDQGIEPGSTAYNNAMLSYSQQADDARWGAVSQAGSEQQRMQQEAQAQGQFQNAAQQQAYEQMLGAGGFANQAQAQQFQQNAAQGAFQNAGLAQQLSQQQSAFNAQQAGLGSYLQQQYAARNQPINEITSLLSGAQVQQPNFINTPGAQIPTTDYAGIAQQNFQNQMGIYQQQNTNYNALMGGILGLGAGALKPSDERLKENVVRVGSIFATDVDNQEGKSADNLRHELPIYQYSYKQDPLSFRHVGPMAQDVEKIDRGAVKSINGIKYIDQRRVMGNILGAAR